MIALIPYKNITMDHLSLEQKVFVRNLFLIRQIFQKNNPLDNLQLKSGF